MAVSINETGQDRFVAEFNQPSVFAAMLENVCSGTNSDDTIASDGDGFGAPAWIGLGSRHRDDSSDIDQVGVCSR